MGVDVDRVEVSGAPGSAHSSSSNRQDLADVSVIALGSQTVVVSSNRGLWFSTNGGQSFSSLGSYGSSQYNTPRLQRINSRSTSTQEAAFKERDWSGVGNWRYRSLSQGVTNGSPQSVSLGSNHTVSPAFRLANSDRGKVPRALAVDYFNNLLSLFGYQWNSKTL